MANGYRSARPQWPHVVILDPFTAGLAAARRMVRLGAHVTMLVDPCDMFVDRTRGVHSIVSPFGADGAEWFELLQRIAAAGDEIVVLPSTDRSCELLLETAHQLTPNVHMFERGSVAHRTLMDKERANAIARTAGVRVPWSAIVNSPAEIDRAVLDAPWPCVVKPILSHDWRARYGDERVFLVADANEARERLRVPLQDGTEMILSQYIPGGDNDVEEAIVVRLADGSYPVLFGCHKLRQDPPGFGATTVGEASHLRDTTALARRVLDEASFVGVAGVETKRHAVTGERWFLEVNVRMPGQWGLGDTCGVAATQRLVAALCNRPLGPQPPLHEGVRFLLPHLDAHVVGPALRQTPALGRPAAALRFARAYVGVRDFGLLNVRDPGPGLAWISVIAQRRLNTLKGRIGARHALADQPTPPARRH
jgi:D-aspartate ligase